MNTSPRGERGFTLVEFAIVAALSALVVFTLATFYINAQHMWLDSSLQAVAQRDASLLLDVMTDHAAAADSAHLADATHLYLYRDDVPLSSFTWQSGDDHVLLTEFDATGMETGTSLWPATGKILQLQFGMPAGSGRTVAVDSLEVETSPGDRIFLSTTLLIANRE